MQNAGALFFLYYKQSAQPVSDTRVQALSMTVNVILMTYQIIGSTIYRSMRHACYDVMITITIAVLLIPLMGIGNVVSVCVHLTLIVVNTRAIT